MKTINKIKELANTIQELDNEESQFGYLSSSDELLRTKSKIEMFKLIEKL